jgi:hypothetical protein
MDITDSYRHLANELLARASEEEGMRAAVLVELARLYLVADEADIELTGFAIEFAKTLH